VFDIRFGVKRSKRFVKADLSCAGLLFFAKFNCEGDDGLTKGGVLDADESSVETKSLIRRRYTGPVLRQGPRFTIQTEKIDWPHTQHLGKSEQTLGGNPFRALLVRANVLWIYFKPFGELFLRPAERGSFVAQPTSDRFIDLIGVSNHGPMPQRFE
jgi:hypothetical protein